MPSQLCLSIRFLDAAFHGRRDGGEPEWPPSPLRLFQALVATAAAQSRANEVAQPMQQALKWLENQPAPVVVAPAGITTSGYRLSVPNNSMDIVANAWCRGNVSNTGDANPATHRTMKTVQPTRFLEGDAVHYLWTLPTPPVGTVGENVQRLRDLAEGLVVLGWGVDLVVGHGEILPQERAETLPGERWLPSGVAAGRRLRVAIPGTLEALIERHHRFLARLTGDCLTVPPTVSRYGIVGYRRSTDPASRPIAAFSLLRLDASGFRAFDTARRALTVVGMIRHATKTAAIQGGWSDSEINAFILGHGETKGNTGHAPVGPRRFAFLPVPSIETRGSGKGPCVGGVRRFMLTAFSDDCEKELTWARRALPGRELIDERTHDPIALISLIPGNEKVLRYYTQPASCWASVTPVVLPGFDDPAHYRRRLKNVASAAEQAELLDRLGKRVEGLLRKAIVQAGFSRTLAERAEIEWRKVGFWPGADLADRYGVPSHLSRFPRCHVRICWRDPDGSPVQIAGPICMGGGRFYGLGLFASM